MGNKYGKFTPEGEVDTKMSSPDLKNISGKIIAGQDVTHVPAPAGSSVDYLCLSWKVIDLIDQLLDAATEENFEAVRRFALGLRRCKGYWNHSGVYQVDYLPEEGNEDHPYSKPETEDQLDVQATGDQGTEEYPYIPAQTNKAMERYACEQIQCCIDEIKTRQSQFQTYFNESTLTQELLQQDVIGDLTGLLLKNSRNRDETEDVRIPSEQIQSINVIPEPGQESVSTETIITEEPIPSSKSETTIEEESLQNFANENRVLVEDAFPSHLNEVNIEQRQMKTKSLQCSIPVNEKIIEGDSIQSFDKGSKIKGEQNERQSFQSYAYDKMEVDLKVTASETRLIGDPLQSFSDVEETEKIIEREQFKCCKNVCEIEGHTAERPPFQSYENENRIECEPDKSSENEYCTECEPVEIYRNEYCTESEPVQSYENEDITEKKPVQCYDNEDSTEMEPVRHYDKEYTESEPVQSYQSEYNTKREPVQSYENECSTEREGVQSYDNEDITEREPVQSYDKEDITERESVQSYDNEYCTETESVQSYDNEYITERESVQSYDNEYFTEPLECHTISNITEEQPYECFVEKNNVDFEQVQNYEGNSSFEAELIGTEPSKRIVNWSETENDSLQMFSSETSISDDQSSEIIIKQDPIQNYENGMEGYPFQSYVTETDSTRGNIQMRPLEFCINEEIIEDESVQSYEDRSNVLEELIERQPVKGYVEENITEQDLKVNRNDAGNLDDLYQSLMNKN